MSTLHASTSSAANPTRPTSASMMQECIDRCLACQRGAIMTLTCLRDMGGAAIEPARVRCLLDCADACQVAATFMMRGSQRFMEMCAVAARICRDAADRCDGTNLEQLRKLVDACRTCETSCRELINAQAELPAAA